MTIQKQTIVKFLLIGFLTFTLHCGSGSTNGGGSNLNSTQAEQVGFILEFLDGSIELVLVVVPDPSTADVSCENSGTITFDQSGSVTTITLVNCTGSEDSDGDGDNDVNDVVNGTLTYDSTTELLTYNITVVSTNNSSGVATTYVFGQTADVNLTNGGIAYDVSGTVGVTSFAVTGSATESLETSVIDGTVNVTLGSADIQCVFNNFDAANSTPLEFANNCLVI